MDRPRSGSRQTDADLTGEFGMSTGHKSGHLLVAHLNELRPISRPIEASHNAINAVARIPVDPCNAPIDESLDEKIADRRTHGKISFSVSTLIVIVPGPLRKH